MSEVDNTMKEVVFQLESKIESLNKENLNLSKFCTIPYIKVI